MGGKKKGTFDDADLRSNSLLVAFADNQRMKELESWKKLIKDNEKEKNNKSFSYLIYCFDSQSQKQLESEGFVVYFDNAINFRYLGPFSQSGSESIKEKTLILILEVLNNGFDVLFSLDPTDPHFIDDLLSLPDSSQYNLIARSHRVDDDDDDNDNRLIRHFSGSLFLRHSKPMTRLISDILLLYRMAPISPEEALTLLLDRIYHSLIPSLFL